MSSQATSVRFSGTPAAVLISLVVVGVVAFPLILFAFVIPSPWSYVWAALILSTTLAAVIRTRRISLVVGSDSVEVNNLWRSYRIPWESIESVGRTGRSMLGEGPGDQTIEFMLRGGRDVHSQATFGPPFSHTPMLQEIARHAEEWNIDMP